MSDITFESVETTLDDLMAGLPDVPAMDMGVDQAEFDALIAELAQDYPVASGMDTSEPEIDPQELENWLDSLEPASFDMDL